MKEARIVDPRAVRVAILASTGRDGMEPIMLEPPGSEDGLVLIESSPSQVRLRRFDRIHSELIEGAGDDAQRTAISLVPLERQAGLLSGVVQREVLVDGWRVVVEIESERHASLRERARGGREETVHSGPTQVRAIIPGRIVSVSIVPGDQVVAGQQLLVVEAMKMQNELRAPRDGVVSSVAVGAGGTIEVGDLLMVLE